MEKFCLIISGGDFDPVKDELKKADYIIACDKGYAYAEKMGIKSDIIIGDFDSISEPKTDIPILRYPVEKDDTDTMLAVKHALDRGFKSIVICCAFGGRADHALANIQAASYAVERGARVSVIGRDTELLVFSNGCERFKKKEGWSLSVLALSDECHGVNIMGTKYEGKDLILKNTFPLGVSNECVEDEAVISVKKGIILVLRSKMKGTNDE